MGIVRRQSIKTSVGFALGVLVSYFNILWLFPYCLSSEEIGLVRITISTATILATLITLGGQHTTIRFFPYFKENNTQHNGFLPLILLISTASGLLITGILLPFSSHISALFEKRSPLLAENFLYVFPIGFLLAYTKVLISFSKSLLKAVIPNVFQTVMFRVLLGGTVLLYYFGSLSLEGIMLGLVFIHLAVLLLHASYIGHLGGLHLDFRKIKVKGYRILEMLRFGSYSMFTSVGAVLIQHIDNLMLGALASLGDTGVYSIAFSIGVLIDIPKRSMIQITYPLIAKARKENDTEKVEELYKKSSTNLLLIGTLLFTGIWINLDDLYSLMPNGERFQEGSIVVLLIAGSKLLAMSTGPNGTIITSSTYYHYNFILSLLTILLLISLNYWLIPAYGMTGAALTSFIALGIMNLSQLQLIRAKERIQPFSIGTLKGILTGGVVLAICLALPSFGRPILDIPVRSLVAILLFGGSNFLLRTSPEGNELLVQQFNKFLKRK